ncbi:MAG: HDIG domain-containing protein [Prolixibacteraceae bacterium]|jgi:putative nucleotidyltransferase with HDIG domain|nr:HDIG domain-containing protein [Prolixibacteraceae bacterium]
MGTKNNKLLSLFRKFYFAIFLIATFGVIYFLFPKQGTFKYEFQKGKPWAHETLIASFDFPIQKPNEVIQAEKDSLLSNYVPYFSVFPSVKDNQIGMLENNLEQTFERINVEVDSTEKALLKNKLLGIVDTIYSSGILNNSVDSYTALEDKENINKVEGNRAVKVPVSSVYSIKSAYVELSDSINKLSVSHPLLLDLQENVDFSNFLVSNLNYDEEFNNTKIEELINDLSTTRGAVLTGVRVISEGDLVNNDNYIILQSLKQAYEKNRMYGGWISTIFVGQMILIAGLLAVMVLYLQNFNKKVFWKKRNFSLILTTLLVVVILARLVYENDSLNMYILPVCMLPIIIRTFLGARMAIMIHVITVLIIGFMAPNSFEFVLIQIVAGIVAVVSLSKLHRRGHLIITSLILILTYSILYIGFEIIKEADINNIGWRDLSWFVGNGFLLLIAYPLIYVFEKVFGFLSDVTLVELSDTNHPLLRKLAEVAPGTFQHSMQVANLSEEIILRIGGNPMLVRTGALYHDVGKINSSQYFIENQLVGDNPHDKLSNKKSVEKIVSHVFDGVRLAKKYNIPDTIIDFIKMHHGKSLVKYFYLKQKEQNPDVELKKEDFMYPGPNPTTRETAVVMLSDSIEAASRSLPEKNEESLNKLINQIINSKVDNHELDDAPLTFKDIKVIKAIFLEKMKNIYHVRIQYPSEEKEQSDKNQKEEN